MDVLINGKTEEDLIINEGTRVVTALYIDFSDAQGHLTSFSVAKLILALMVVFVTCKNEAPFKNEGARVFTTFSPICKSMGIFSNNQGQLTPQSMDGSG